MFRVGHPQANSLRRIARPTGRSLPWCESLPWSSDSTPCCARSISCNPLLKNSMVHSLMSRKSASIGSRRRRDNWPAYLSSHVACVSEPGSPEPSRPKKARTQELLADCKARNPNFGQRKALPLQAGQPPAEASPQDREGARCASSGQAARSRRRGDRMTGPG